MAYKRTSPLPIVEGGTNATTMATTDGVVYYDGTSLVTTAVGTATHVLTSNGVGLAPTFQAPPASGVTSITGDTGGAQTGAITLTGGTTGASYGGAAGTITMTFAGITANGGSVNLGTDNAANAINIGQGTTARTISIGDSAAAHAITIGTLNTTASTTIQSGTGDLQLSSTDAIFVDAAGIVQLNSTGGSLNIGNDADAQAINIGTGAAARTITIGNTTGATDLDLRCGTGDFTLASATGTIINALDTGEITKPLQPAFFAILASADNNVTGAGASYVIGTNVALTEIFDQNADFNTNGTFTAPVTGRYAFYGNVGLNGVTASTFDMRFRIVASNRRYDFYLVGATISASMTELAGSAFIDMDSGDICQLIINGSGGTDVIDLAGNATEAITSFGGYLVC